MALALPLGAISTVPGDAYAAFVALREDHTRLEASLSVEALEHRDRIRTVPFDTGSVEGAYGDGESSIHVPGFGGCGVRVVGLHGFVLAVGVEVVEPSKYEQGIGVVPGGGGLLEVPVDLFVIRGFVRFVIARQGPVCVGVALQCGSEEPHVGLFGVLADHDTVEVADTHGVLSHDVSPSGGTEIPVECGLLVGLRPLSGREPLSKLEAGLHVPCLGLGNQML